MTSSGYRRVGHLHACKTDAGPIELHVQRHAVERHVGPNGDIEITIEIDRRGIDHRIRRSALKPGRVGDVNDHIRTYWRGKSSRQHDKKTAASRFIKSASCALKARYGTGE